MFVVIRTVLDYEGKKTIELVCLIQRFPNLFELQFDFLFLKKKITQCHGNLPSLREQTERILHEE